MDFRCIRSRTGFAAVLLLAAGGEAFAHTSDRGFVMLLPTQYYLVGGSLAVAVSFILLALVPTSWFRPATEEAAASQSPQPHNRLRIWTSCLSFLLMSGLIAVGLEGSRDPLSNLLPLTIWTIWWVGFPLLHALFGNFWFFLNPWSGPVHLLGKLLPVGRLSYPAGLGYWPAIVGFGLFAWFELISLSPEDPEVLAQAVALYFVSTLAAMLLFGERDWSAKAECFSVFFRLIARLSVFGYSGGPTIRWPGAALLKHKALPASGVIFVLLTLSAVSFDGYSKTFVWMSAIGINPLAFPGRSAVTGANTFGLAAMWLLLSIGFYGALVLGHLLCRNPPPLQKAAGMLIYSIIPISLGYHLAHYLTVLLVNGQYALAALSDPFGLGWDLLALQPFTVTTSFLNTAEDVAIIWNVQSGAIVVGHVLAVLTAHRLSLGLHDNGNDAVLSQLPLALVMVGYTLFGLWLLSAPTGA